MGDARGQVVAAMGGHDDLNSGPDQFRQGPGHVLTGPAVQSVERLVEDQKFRRIRDQGPDDEQPAPLTFGQPAQLASRQAAQIEQIHDTLGLR